jgi:hypothetical protein
MHAFLSGRSRSDFVALFFLGGGYKDADIFFVLYQ